MARAKSNGSKDSSANLGFKAKIWLSADKPRNNMDAAEYEHVVLGLIFLNRISNTFDEKVEANRRQSLTLAKLRDTLLPKHLSGELRWDSAAAAVEESHP